MQVIVPTYSALRWAVAPFLHLVDKFWMDAHDIVIISEDDITGGKCQFRAIPSNLLSPTAIERYSDVLIWYIANVMTDSQFIIMLIDYWLLKEVNREALNTATDYMTTDPDIMRIQLGTGSGVNVRCDKNFRYQDITIYECEQPRHCFLPTSLTPGLWSKERFLEIIQPNLNPWATETESERRYQSWFPRFRSLGMEPEPIDYFNVIRGRCNDDLMIPGNLLPEIESMIPKNKRITVLPYA